MKDLEQAVVKLSKKYDLDAIKTILFFGYDSDLTNNEELTELDIYDALQAIFLSIIKVALEQENYELVILVNKAHEKQAIIMKKNIAEAEMDEDEREEDFWHLHFTNEYFENSKQNLATNE